MAHDAWNYRINNKFEKLPDNFDKQILAVIELEGGNKIFSTNSARTLFNSEFTKVLAWKYIEAPNTNILHWGFNI